MMTRLLDAALVDRIFLPSPLCLHLVKQPGGNIAKVFLLQLVLFATGSIDADVLEGIHDFLRSFSSALLRAFNAASSSPPEEPAPVRPEPADGWGALAYLIAHCLAT
jgi:hypothetical protein